MLLQDDWVVFHMEQSLGQIVQRISLHEVQQLLQYITQPVVNYNSMSVVITAIPLAEVGVPCVSWRVTASELISKLKTPYASSFGKIVTHATRKAFINNTSYVA